MTQSLKPINHVSLLGIDSIEQSFELGLLHADPHPGNLAWTEDGQLVIYDFGSVLEVEPALLKAYLKLYEALRGPDSAALEPAFQALGGRRRGSSPATPAACGRGWPPGGRECGP